MRNRSKSPLAAAAVLVLALALGACSYQDSRSKATIDFPQESEQTEESE